LLRGPSVGEIGQTVLSADANGNLVFSVDGGVTTPVGALNLQASEGALAQSLLGNGGLLPFFHPTAAIGTNGLTRHASGSAPAPSPSAGSLLVATSATASQFNRLIGFSDGTNWSQFARPGQPWYVSSRHRVATAITAQTKAFAGFGDSGVASGGSLRMGIDGANSTAFFCLAGTGGVPIVTAIPIDTAFHTFRAWRTGGTTFFQIDGGAILTGSTDIGANNGSPFVHVENGTDAANRTIEVAWFAGFCPPI
jgi:hypothetical protein